MAKPDKLTPGDTMDIKIGKPGKRNQGGKFAQFKQGFNFGMPKKGKGKKGM